VYLLARIDVLKNAADVLYLSKDEGQLIKEL